MSIEDDDCIDNSILINNRDSTLEKDLGQEKEIRIEDLLVRAKDFKRDEKELWVKLVLDHWSQMMPLKSA
ncbi:25781_t:CDS:2, partial [Gigaspora rosea]